MTVLLISPSANYASAAVQTCDYCGEENDRFDKTWLKTPGGLIICPACQEESQAEKRNQRVASRRRTSSGTPMRRSFRCPSRLLLKSVKGKLSAGLQTERPEISEYQD